MIEALLHCDVTKKNGVFYATTRTEDFAELLRKKCEEKGMQAEISVRKAPHYFKSKQEHLDHILNTHPDFQSFSDFFGLKLVV